MTSTLSNPFKRSWGDLDHIALEQVIQQTLYPHVGFLDSSLTQGPDSPWCKSMRWKTGLTTISHHWRIVALPHLYRHVILRRIDQVFAFAELLRADTNNAAGYGPGALVRSITFKCFVYPADDVREEFITAVVEILKRCENIKELGFGPTFAVSTDVQGLDAIETPWDNNLHHQMRGMLERIEVFKIGDDFNCMRENIPPSLLSYLSEMSLKILDIPLSAAMYYSVERRKTWWKHGSKVKLRLLEEITIWERDLVSGFKDVSNWELPCLRRVNVIAKGRCLDGSDFGVGRGHRRLWRFLQAHAPTIRELNLIVTHPLPSDDLITHQMTNLTYICLHMQSQWTYDLFEQLCVDQRPELHVDLWVEFRRAPPAPLNDHSKSPIDYLVRCHDNTPHLRSNVRILDCGIAHFPDLHRHFPPSNQGGRQLGDPPIVHDLFGIPILETSFAVLYFDHETNEVDGQILVGGNLFLEELGRQFPALLTLTRWQSESPDFDSREWSDQYVWNCPADTSDESGDECGGDDAQKGQCGEEQSGI
ncbi:hypothetical protein BXZ70DRAFT_1062301 [Cristinia sonorae]|uniref:Uncharacterized protein n=1 Tax=Cristinia sonorae TaxID=1940300 RepID=A0A8K0UUC6_9AGAR|nr:hypothetical protein BXZ70DRAFT_1062301 [Cristinia sonorae]